MHDYSGFLVIGRYVHSKDWVDPKSNVRNSQMNIRFEDFKSRFKGFDGDIWLYYQDNDPPTEDGILANIDDYDKIRLFYDAKSPQSKCDLIYIHDAINPNFPSFLKEDFFFCGYELGIYISLYDYWSSIANEVVNGVLPEMMNFFKCLNEHFLVPDINTAQRLSEVRQRLCNAGHSGKELEDIESSTNGEPCHILEVYCYKY